MTFHTYAKLSTTANFSIAAPYQCETDRPALICSPLWLVLQPLFVDQALAKFNQLKPCFFAGLVVFAEEMDIAADGDCSAVGAMVVRRRPAHQKERVIADENEITRGNEQTRRLS